MDREISNSSASVGNSWLVLSNTIATSARPPGLNLLVPLKIKSVRLFARMVFLLRRPRQKQMPSMTLDLPDPFGPTMQVNPLDNFTVTFRLPKLLNPVIEIRLIAVIIFLPANSSDLII
ncbi:MAG: hypothetical protein RBG13Loki_1320 [Promethearchaeota archaeon CR_4]|nr:MAG: hypothetical protein RBG13Loki_1320 [Candidatus Lokiarchaeota archaeon CR_4]